MSADKMIEYCGGRNYRERMYGKECATITRIDALISRAERAEALARELQQQIAEAHQDARALAYGFHDD